MIFFLIVLLSKSDIKIDFFLFLDLIYDAAITLIQINSLDSCKKLSKQPKSRISYKGDHTD